ncbi:SMC-Scp complex subunit ScpB [Planctomicrobium sp. SH668]|uniref:SMC-Scp complex subunit ScpB n=1 Tax=Planctomicrobium sp. SH668 TaxID=3448126 RepID=UPI003F5BE3C0
MSSLPEDNPTLHEAICADLPFHVVVKGSSATPLVEKTDSIEESTEEEVFSLDEIEAAYLRALESADQAEFNAIEQLDSHSINDGNDEFVPTSKEFEESPLPVANAEQRPSTPVEEISPLYSEGEEAEQIVRAEHVVEAMLFVGGAPLPIAKFVDVLGGTYTDEQVEVLLTEIRNRYECQKRPYQVVASTEGYALRLCSDYESIRGKAYGQTPKEVKLAQDALEVLAFIAYQQPVDKESLTATEKPNVQGLVRTLLRRELIRVDRSDAEKGEQYRTTPRFLELFGLASLDDLPQTGSFSFR